MTLAQLIADVRARGNYWSALDQGRWAALSGHKRTSNPFHAVRPHVAYFDWQQGYDSASAPDMHLTALIG